MKSIFSKISMLVALLIALQLNVISQPWAESLPADRESKTKLTLFDYQKAFDNYWAPYNVENGYYFVDGEKIKALGWKQFKRWEWFWTKRINPQTGEFPKRSALEVYNDFMKENGGQRSTSGNWASMGPTSSTGGYAGIGRINCVGFHPTDNNTFYIGAAAGGIWETTDGGSTWTAIGDDNASLGVSDIIVVDGTPDDIIYLATGDRDHSDAYSVGVLKSMDGGTTWNTTGLSWTQSQGYIINRLIMDPNNNNILYAATNGGVYKTTNGGTSWSQITTEVFKDLEFNAGNSAMLYGSTGWGEIYRSTNSGSSWTMVFSQSAGRNTRIAVTDDNSSVVYVVMANSSSALHGIFKSTDSGVTFSQIFSGSTTNLLDWACDGSGSGGQGWYDLCIAVDPNDADNLFVGGVNTWESTDGGSTWDISNHWSGTCGGQATTVHADKHYLEYQNSSSDLFECSDGGIYKTSDGGNSWTDLTNTLVISQMYRIGVAQTVANDVVCGLQDNGTKSEESNVWDDVIGGDGMDCAINPSNANIQYGELYYGDIRRTTDHWNTKTIITDNISGSGAWVTPYVIDPNNNQTLFLGYDDVWKSTNQGNNWTKISNWAGSNMQSMAVASSNSSYIYTATYSTIYMTSNGGSSWTDISSGLPVFSNNISNISVKDDDPNTVWVSISGFNTDGVYKTTNGGSSWTNISTGLPQLPVNWVVQNRQNTSEEEIYAATDVGVYVKVGSANWTIFSTGLPNVVVNEVEIYYDDATTTNSKLRAGTFGRGLWESDLYSAINPPLTDFIADNTIPTTADTVHFTDLSTNSPTSWSWVITPSTFTFIEGTDTTSQNPIAIFNVPGFYTVELTATNAGGSNTEAKVDYINCSQAIPIADFEADNTTPSTIDTVYFTDLSVNDPSSWLWAFDPNTITYQYGDDENSQNPRLIFDATGFYSVTLTATNTGGSDDEIKTDYINVSLALSVTTSAVPDEICLGETTQLDAQAGGGSENFTYSWTSNPTGFTSTLQNPVDSPQITTTYIVDVNDGLTSVSDSTEVIVNDLPVISLGNWPGTLCNQLEPPVQLTATPEGGTYSGNVSVDGIFTPETATLGWNIITYTFEDANTCVNTAADSIFVDNCVGIENQHAGDLIKVFPNPNNGNFQISSLVDISNIEIISQLGKLKYSQDVKSKDVTINSTLEKGIYIIRIYLENDKIINKEVMLR